MCHYSVAIMIICKDIKLSSAIIGYCKRVFNEAAKRMIRSNSAQDVDKTVPENWQILTTQNLALHCSYEQDSETKMTTPKIWKCGITSTMTQTNLESSSLGPRYCVSIWQISKVLVLCYKSHFITFRFYHDHLQGHQVVINDAAKEFSTMLLRE